MKEYKVQRLVYTDKGDDLLTYYRGSDLTKAMNVYWDIIEVHKYDLVQVMEDEKVLCKNRKDLE